MVLEEVRLPLTTNVALKLRRYKAKFQQLIHYC